MSTQAAALLQIFNLNNPETEALRAEFDTLATALVHCNPQDGEAFDQDALRFLGLIDKLPLGLSLPVINETHDLVPPSIRVKMAAFLTEKVNTSTTEGVIDDAEKLMCAATLARMSFGNEKYLPDHSGVVKQLNHDVYSFLERVPHTHVQGHFEALLSVLERDSNAFTDDQRGIVQLRFAQRVRQFLSEAEQNQQVADVYLDLLHKMPDEVYENLAPQIYDRLSDACKLVYATDVVTGYTDYMKPEEASQAVNHPFLKRFAATNADILAARQLGEAGIRHLFRLPQIVASLDNGFRLNDPASRLK